jgi:hypothetical protein
MSGQMSGSLRDACDGLAAARCLVDELAEGVQPHHAHLPIALPRKRGIGLVAEGATIVVPAQLL